MKMRLERRKSKRKHLYEFFDAVDSHSDSPIGKLVDVSAGGMKIMTRQKVDPETDVELKVVLPKEFREGSITVHAKSKWCHVEPSGTFETGLQLVGLSDEIREKIKMAFEGGHF